MPRGAGATRRASAVRTAAPHCVRRRGPVWMREPDPRPSCSSVSTYSLSVATCQSASRAMVRPTARVSRTAVSRSTTPSSTSRDSRSIASRSAAGEGDRAARVGEAQRAPQPAGPGPLGVVVADEFGDREARRLAEDLPLEVLAVGTAWPAGRRLLAVRGPSPAVRLRTSERRAVVVGAVVVAEQQVGDLQLHGLDVRHVVQRSIGPLRSRLRSPACRSRGCGRAGRARRRRR